MIRVVLVDDQRLMREGLRTLLSLENDIEVAGECVNGQEALEFRGYVNVDVILMDIRMPEKNGIEATRGLMTSYPHLKILMLTTFEEREDVVEALESGAVGYLLKDMPAEEIAEAVRIAYQGGAVLPPSVAKTFLTAVQKDMRSQTPSDPSQGVLVASTRNTQDFVSDADASLPLESLTDREEDVLHCLARGMSNREIAQSLFVTEGTVKNHVSSLISKLNLRDRTQVALYAVRRGYGAVN